MCNAWNHSPECRCGWGGDGHLGAGHDGRGGRRGGAVVTSARSILYAGDSYPFEGELRIDYARDGFCRPTICPKCGGPVFFVRHNGGSVWFDELGWPWEKHGCFAGDDRHGKAGLGDSLRSALREVTTEGRDGTLGVIVSSDRTTTVEGRRYTLLCGDGAMRRLMISSDYSQGLIMGRFGVLFQGRNLLVLLHPTYRIRVTRIEKDSTLREPGSDADTHGHAAQAAAIRPVDVQPSDALAVIVGSHRLPRTEVTKKVWDYIRSNNLLDSRNRRQVNADGILRAVVGKRQVSMYELPRLVDKHLTD